MATPDDLALEKGKNKKRPPSELAAMLHLKDADGSAVPDKPETLYQPNAGAATFSISTNKDGSRPNYEYLVKASVAAHKSAGSGVTAMASPGKLLQVRFSGRTDLVNMLTEFRCRTDTTGSFDPVYLSESMTRCYRKRRGEQGR